MKKYYIFGLMIFLVIMSGIYVSAELYITEGRKLTSVDVFISHSSEFILPAEEELITITFLINPYLEDIKTNESFYIDYIFIKPDGSFSNFGYISLPKGPYLKNNKYHADLNVKLSTPGIWKIYYVVTTNKDSKNIAESLFSSSTTNEYFSKVQLQSKEIHVLSFYEINTMRISNNSLKISLIGVIGTFLAFLLGLFGNFIIDKYNNSPKIKVICSHGFITYPNQRPCHILNIEIRNKGRVAVNLSNVGIELKKQFHKGKEKLQIMDSDIAHFQFPYRLLPGENFTVMKDYKKLKRDLMHKIPLKAYFKDQIGNTYYSKKIKKLLDIPPSEN